MTCSWLGYDDDDKPIGCSNLATHWSEHRGDHVGAGPVCAEHRCRHGGETLEEHAQRVAPTPSSWLAL